MTVAVRARAPATLPDEECKRLAAWGVPAKDLRSPKLMNPKRTAAIDVVGFFGDRAPGAVHEALTLAVLSGGLGCGKTFAGSWWLARGKRQVPPWHTRLERPRFITAAEFERQSRYEGEAATLERARALVIDDLGMEYADSKGNFLADFDALINRRYSDELPTLITTNLTVKMFRERYGQRIVSRMRESGRFFNVNGPNLREKESPNVASR